MIYIIEISKIDDVHIHNGQVQKKIKDALPPFVAMHLVIVRGPQLDSYIDPLLEGSVL